MSIVDTKAFMQPVAQHSISFHRLQVRGIPSLPALAIVEALDVFRDVTNCLSSAPVVAVVNQFLLEGAPEALHRRVVKTIACPAHGSLQSKPFQKTEVEPILWTGIEAC